MMAEDSFTNIKQIEQEENEEKEMMEKEIDEEDKRAASKLTCLEDIVEVVGSCGRWNMCLFLLCSSSEYVTRGKTK